MKTRTLVILSILTLLAGSSLLSTPAHSNATQQGQTLPFRASEPLETITADLENFIPTYMQEQKIPGVALALVRDNQVAWVGTFGSANTLTGRPVNPDSIFKVASNSKVVTAYIALQMVDKGLLALDTPLDGYLSEHWLPESDYREKITLRQVLSHSAGLGHTTTSRESLFAPGKGYSYSAIGYEYLQAVIEQVSGQSLETVAREMVFEPLGMPSSSFLNRPAYISFNANGHVNAVLPSLIFVLEFLILLLVVSLVSRLLARIRTGRWKLTRRATLLTYASALVLSLLVNIILFGTSGLLEFAILIAMCGLVLSATFAVLYLAGRFLILRWSPKGSRSGRVSILLWSMLVIAGIGLLVFRIPNLPVPKWAPNQADAAGSMRATAGELAYFLIELSRPQHLSAEVAEQMRTSQVKLRSGLSWGLGPGIQHSSQGDALWQWGQHIDFQSIMIIYPEHGFGVVVLTNNDMLKPDSAVDIAQRALGGEIEPIRQAIHLQFNYREPESE
jgi:CubicO group peptidase (beta-lactamase class C family)